MEHEQNLRAVKEDCEQKQQTLTQGGHFMKHIAIILEAACPQPICVTIEPGTTPSEVLDKVKEISGLDLNGYALSKGDARKFRKNQKIYPKVEDGEELCAFKVSKVTA